MGVTLLPSPDPGFYQEVRERGLDTSHESDDDLLDEPSSPGGAQREDATIVVKSYRPAQVTWSQLPEVGQDGLRPAQWLREVRGISPPGLWWPGLHTPASQEQLPESPCGRQACLGSPSLELPSPGGAR